MAANMFDSSCSDSSHDNLNIDDVDTNSMDVPYDKDVSANKDVTHNNQDQSLTPPYVDQTFTSIEEAENFYRLYARSIGFEIKIGASRKYVNSTALSNRLSTCKKVRKPVGKKIHNTGPEKKKEKEDGEKKRLDRSDNVPRMFVVHVKKDNTWKVSTVHLNHNHELVDSSQVTFIETRRNINPVSRGMIETLNKAGVGTSKIMNVFGEIGGGIDKVEFSDTDVRNVVRDIRRDNIDAHDAQAALNHLKTQSMLNPLFFYDYKRGEDGRLRCILWIDYRSMIAYKNFGDVVTYDTTYRTNKYKMSFVPFTGVNHHYQSILFAFALIKDEKEETFVWVFETWLEAMNNKAPIAIITDQEKSMTNAIARVLPNMN